MYKILIVDDEKMVIESIKGKIDWEKHRAQLCGTCCNGKLALEMIQKTSPDIIIIDMKMPVMDGRDLISRLADAHITCEIIVSSAYTEFQYTQIAIQTNVVDYLVKPIKVSQINEAIDKAIKNIKARNMQYVGSILGDLHKQTEDGASADVDTREYGLILVGLTSKQGHGDLDPLTDADLAHFRNGLERLPVASEAIAADVFRKKTWLHEFIIVLTFEGSSINKNAIEAEDFAGQLTGIFSEGCNGFVSISETYQRMGDIVPKYRELHREMYFMNLFRTGLTKVRARRQELIPRQFVTEDEQSRLTLAVRRCETEAVQAWMAAAVEKLTDAAFLSMAEIDLFLHRITGAIHCAGEAADGNSRQMWHGNAAGFGWEPLTFASSKELSAQIMAYLRPLWQKALCESAKNTKQTVYLIKNTIDRQYNRQLSLKGFAEQNFLGEDYLSKLFKQEFGINFIAYLTQVRMEKAVKLLRAGGESVADIAYMVGYSDPKYFCRAFKKIYGKSPSGYR